jgi:hypothetical protein
MRDPPAKEPLLDEGSTHDRLGAHDAIRDSGDETGTLSLLTLVPASVDSQEFPLELVERIDRLEIQTLQEVQNRCRNRYALNIAASIII